MLLGGPSSRRSPRAVPAARRSSRRPSTTHPSITTPQLADVPTRLDVTTDAPMSGNAPGARSPLLDIMPAENARWMATLGKQLDPAYFLQYQIVEQRVVQLDAEGGALVGLWTLDELL